MALRFKVIWLSLLLAVNTAQAQDRGASLETERGNLKIVYLFNIAKFVSWPDESESVRLCLRADSPIRRFALELHGRSLGDGRRFVLETLPRPADGCDIVFDDAVDTQESNTHSNWDTPAVLTVSDSPQAIERGFAVQLFFEAEKLRFAVNHRTVTSADYQVSSKLMRLARLPEGS